MDYIFIVLGFISTVIASLGKTKDSSKFGVKALLPLGWAALAISATMVVLTGYKTYNSNEAVASAAKSAAEIEAAAKGVLFQRLQQGLEGPNVLYRQCTSGANFPSIAALRGENFMDCVAALDARQEANDPKYLDQSNPRQSVADAMARASIAGREALWRDILNYKSAIKAPLWAQLSEFHAHRAFPIFEDISMNKKFSHLPHTIMESNNPAYLELIESAVALQSLLTERDTLYKDSRR